MYSEAQRLANLRYREKKREQINEKERLRYLKMKEEDPEKYLSRLNRCSELACIKSKERTQLNQHIKKLMRIAV